MTAKYGLDRNKAVPALIGNPDDFLIIAGLAGPAKDIGNMTDKAFLFGGAMGGAVTAALGLALAQPDKRVVCVTGDGDLLTDGRQLHLERDVQIAADAEL